MTNRGTLAAALAAIAIAASTLSAASANALHDLVKRSVRPGARSAR